MVVYATPLPIAPYPVALLGVSYSFNMTLASKGLVGPVDHARTAAFASVVPAPEVAHLAVNPHVGLVETPSPVGEGAQVLDALPADLGGEHRAVVDGAAALYRQEDADPTRKWTNVAVKVLDDVRRPECQSATRSSDMSKFANRGLWTFFALGAWLSIPAIAASAPNPSDTLRQALSAQS